MSPIVTREVVERVIFGNHVRVTIERLAGLAGGEPGSLNA